MAECLAVIERGDFSRSPAARAGASAGCPFCRARGAVVPEGGDQILFIHGRRAGVLAKVSDTPNTTDINGFFVTRESVSRTSLERASLDSDLFAPLPLEPIPEWCPPFSLRRSFIIDELAVWFCNRGLIGGNFHWKRSDIAVMVRGCWQSKLAILPPELSAVTMAHGMPANRQAELEDYFEFGIAALIYAAGRRAVKKWRQPSAMKDEFSDAMRFWGR